MRALLGPSVLIVLLGCNGEEDPAAPDATTLPDAGPPDGVPADAKICSAPGFATATGSLGGHSLVAAEAFHVHGVTSSDAVYLDEHASPTCTLFDPQMFVIMFPCFDPNGPPPRPGHYVTPPPATICPGQWVVGELIHSQNFVSYALSGEVELTQVGDCWIGTYSFTAGDETISGDFEAPTCVP